MCSKKLLKSLFTVFLLSVGLFSCSDKDPYVNNGTEPDKVVKISIHTPSSSTVKATRAVETNESTISTIKVLVLQKDGNDYIYKYMVDGQQIVQDETNSQYTTFTALLTGSEVPLKLLLIANANDVFSSGAVQVNMNEQQVRNLLVDSFRSEIAGNLPIYGEIELDELITDKVNLLHTKMLRGIARADVMNQVVSDRFILQNVYVYRANDKIKLVPDNDAFISDASLSVKSPSVPSNASYYEAYKKDVSDDPYAVTQIYLPEANSVDNFKDATCLVVGGIFEGDDSPTYYRVDFDSKIDGHPFGQVLRNYKYEFIIKEVTQSGWENPDDAANNESTSIVASIQVWDELTSEMYFTDDDNYLGISSRKIILEYFEGAEKTVYLQTTIPFIIQALAEDGTPTGNTISKPGESLTNDFYTVNIVKDNSDGADVYQLVITSTDENNTDDQFTGKFLVTAAFWKFDVTVIQETFKATYLNKEINVLTITSLPGDLGTSDGIFTPGVSGDAMRRVLENKKNFSHDGKIPVKSIIVHSFSNEMLSSSNTDYMDILAKMLEHVQVVQLPKGCTPSVEASALIYNWLEEEYYRVLIMGMDTDASSANLRDYYRDVDGTWQYDTDKITGLGTPIFEDDPRHLPFFDGPFGTVPMNLEPMGFVGGDMSYNIGFNWDTTVSLLVARGGLDNEGKMTHGINMEHGIIYCGESEITSSRGSAMSPEAATDGTVTSKFDILMANVWAWIIERVLRG